MQPDRLSDEQLDQLAADLAPRLPTGTHGDRVILPRRQFVAALGGTLGAGALMALGVDEATAQAAGSVGTTEDPVDVNAWDLDVANEVTSDVDMAGNDVSNVGSVSTAGLTVGDQPSQRHFEQISTADLGTGTVDEQFSVPTEYQGSNGIVLVDINIRSEEDEGNPTVKLRVDGETAGYRNLTISPTNGVVDSADNDAFNLATISDSFESFTGRYQLQSPRNRVTIFGDGVARSNFDTDILTRGFGDLSTDLSTIELVTDNPITGGRVRLFGKER